MRMKYSALPLALFFSFVIACTLALAQTSEQTQSGTSNDETPERTEALISLTTVSRGVAISFLVWFAKLFVLSGLERYHTLRLLLVDMAYRMRNIEILIQNKAIETTESLPPEKLDHYVYLSLQKPLRDTLWLSEVDAIRSLYHDFQIVEIQVGKIAELHDKMTHNKTGNERFQTEIEKRYELIIQIYDSWLEASGIKCDQDNSDNARKTQNEENSPDFSKAVNFTGRFVFNRIPIYMTAHALPILALAILILNFAGVSNLYWTIVGLIIVLNAIIIGWLIILTENQQIKKRVESAWEKTNGLA